jgi:hypothetical protein
MASLLGLKAFFAILTVVFSSAVSQKNKGLKSFALININF